MFSHIMLGARDLEKMVDFYDCVLAPLALQRDFQTETGVDAGVIWKSGDRRWPQFALRKPISGLPATWGNGVQISFAAPSRSAVNDAWDAAIRMGGISEGSPGIRPRYAADFYAAYCRDPEGNKLCFVHADNLAL
ncbi:VOC family protein [Agrobacterium pusense]|uniref:VOC family protein n=1 Tax=Agrobacterium pusense TaxID=648995 RepID=UPI00088E149F|nr:VOC family protein [Agrobacterium pusense]OOO15712.1 lactoylglutathione lyase [Agrobacterium pusense]WKD47962.1 VOC family protein [Agrobacterium pusense]SDF44743.1 Catechol 2,3-dioxygenase [Agrobacterium pusense]